MPFTIPNEAAAGFPAQAAPDSGDVAMLVAGFDRTGVRSGCAVTAQATPDMTLAVAAGTVAVLGGEAAVVAANVTIPAADATNPRFDLVVASSAGVLSVVAGTAAAAPAFPLIPASSVVLAAVYVPAGDLAINSNQVVDKRVPVPALAQAAWTTYTPTWTGSGGNPAIGNGTLTGRYCQVGKLVTASIRVVMGSTTTFGSGDYRWGLPVAGALNGIGPAHALDAGTARRNGVAVIESSTTVFVTIPNGGAIWGASEPHVWAANDQIDITITYEAA